VKSLMISAYCFSRTTFLPMAVGACSAQDIGSARQKYRLPGAPLGLNQIAPEAARSAQHAATEPVLSGGRMIFFVSQATKARTLAPLMQNVYDPKYALGGMNLSVSVR
jgi:hypothetical protein